MTLGRFHNLESFSLKPILGTKYKRLLQVPGAEFYYISRDGHYHVPPHMMKTDGGSIPYVFQRIPGLDRDVFLPCYLLHDCNAWYGFVLRRLPDQSDDKVKCCIQRAIFTSDDLLRQHVLEECFTIIPLKWRENDWYLDEAIQTFLVVLNKGTMAVRRMLINVGLAIGGWPIWLKYRWRNKQYQARLRGERV